MSESRPNGFWRFPGHVRKCNLAASFSFEQSIARGRAFFLWQERRRRARSIAKNVAAAILIALVGALVVRLCRP